MLRYVITLAITSFLLGFTLHALLGVMEESYPSLGMPNRAADAASLASLTNPAEQPSPFPRITRDKIRVYEDQVVIQMDKPQWASFTDTNSMDPVFDAGHYAIQVVPESEGDVHVGDIITYTHPAVTQGNLIHRVIKVGYDENGWYAIAKGDNNASPDPEKVRFEQVKKVVAAIIY